MKKIFFILALVLLFIGVSPVKASYPALNDYWNGGATWRPVITLPEDGSSTGPWRTGFEAAAQFIVIGNNWYLFDRHVDWSDSWKAKGCPQGTKTLEVRKSTDSGKTWTAPVDILTNTPPYQSCDATDGGVYYQPSTNTWHILYQCLGPNSAWAGCYATRSGSDPMGPFIPDYQNPVIKSGSLWSKICNVSMDKCVSESTGPIKPPVDEGTFDIFQYDGRYYWVSFHGFDGINGFRGIAKTADFHSWIAGSSYQGVPTDAVLNPSDANNWDINWSGGKSIGIGTSRIIKEGDYWYQFAEAADQTLATGDTQQSWADGIYRSTSLTSISWEQPSAFRNPVNAPDESLRIKDPPAANPNYSGLFRDQSGKIYMHYSRGGYAPEDSGIYLFTLEYKTIPTSTPNPSIKPGDLNNDSKVDINDYNILKNNFGGSGMGDINGNGKVDIFDYNTLISNYGK